MSLCKLWVCIKNTLCSPFCYWIICHCLPAFPAAFLIHSLINTSWTSGKRDLSLGKYKLFIYTDRAAYHMKHFNTSMTEEVSVTILYSHRTNKKYFILMCIKPVDIMHWTETGNEAEIQLRSVLFICCFCLRALRHCQSPLIALNSLH